jgi:hypothetical protein
VLRGVLQAFSTMFGSLGVFSTWMSFLNPAQSVYAVFFIAIAMAILWSSVRE